ncbi:MAG: hypothetical protein ABIF11_11570 [Nitrospirota bacterium]
MKEIGGTFRKVFLSRCKVVGDIPLLGGIRGGYFFPFYHKNRGS